MTPGDDKQFASAIGILAETLPPRTPCSPAMLHGYELALNDLPIEVIRHAVWLALRECKFVPAPEELRKLAGVMDPKQRVLIAWDILQCAAKKHGYRKSVDFDDVLLNATIRALGGWEHFVQMSVAERHGWYKKDFDRVYLAMIQGWFTDAMGAPLMRWSEYDGAFPIVKIYTGLPLADRQRLPAEPPKMLEQFRPQLKKP